MKYVLKKLRMLRIFDLETGKMKVLMNDLKSGQFTGSQETVYAEGAEGAKLAAFDVNKVAGFNATNGSVDLGFLAMQVGGETVEITNGTDVCIHSVLTTANGTTVTLPHKASGEAGNEIGFIYAVGPDGMPAKEYAQAAAASATEFAYDPETKVITLPTGVFKAADEVVVEYHPTFSKYTQLDNESTKFASSGRVVIDAWFTDICNEADVPLQVVMEKGKVSGEVDISIGDQAAVQNIAVEAMSTSCDQNKRLWRLFTYDEQEIVD